MPCHHALADTLRASIDAAGICSTADFWRMRSRWRRTRVRTTKLYDAAMIRSHSIGSNESFSEGCFHSNRSLEPGYSKVKP